MKNRLPWLLCLLLLPLPALLVTFGAGGEDTPRYACRVKATYPHDPADSVQGLLLAGQTLYESTGGYGTSSVASKELATGRCLQRRPLAGELFGEGLALQGGSLYQLTWKSGRVFQYNPADFRLVAEHAIPTQGWGLAAMGDRLVLSDGSAVLHFYAPQGFREIGQVTVTERGRPVTGLNELEWVDGLVYANVYPTAEMVMIDPATGRVTGRADLGGLLAAADPEGKAGVPNGIAYDPQAGRLLVTGKRWPLLFEIELVPELP